MADNNFLSSVKIDQFIKSNNDQIKQSFGGALDGIAKSVSDIMKMQKASDAKLKTIDDKLVDLSNINKTITKIYDLQKIQLKLLTNNDKNFTKQLDTVLGKHYKSERKQNTVVKDTKDYFKRSDPSEETNKLLHGIRYNTGALVEDAKKKIKGGLLGLLGAGAGLLLKGGLLGFLLTGKHEFLFSMVKGLRHTLKGFISSIKGAFNMMMGIPKMISGVPKVFESLSKFAKSFKDFSLIDNISKGFSSFVGHLKNFGNTVTSIGKKLGLISKGADKATKTAKTAKTGLTTAKTVGKTAGKLTGKAAAKRVPILGTLMGIGFGASRIAKGDVTGGLMEFGSAGLGLLDVVAPGAGTALSLAADVAIMARDAKRSATGPTGETGGDALDVKIFKDPAYYKYVKNSNKWANRNKDESHKITKDMKSGYRDSVKKLKDHPQFKDKIRLNPNMSPDLFGVQPEMRERFERLAKAYYKWSGGGYLLVNSGKRSGGASKTNSMHNHGWAIDVNAIGPDGRRLGDGYVPDHLLEEHGFHKPLKYWKRDYGGPLDEPWHIEPYPGESVYGGEPNTLVPNQSYRLNVLAKGESAWASVPQPVGDRGGDNLPIGTVEKKQEKSNTPLLISLSNSDIEKLATAFGKQIRDNTPTPKRSILPAGGSNGRGNL